MALLYIFIVSKLIIQWSINRKLYHETGFSIHNNNLLISNRFDENANNIIRLSIFLTARLAKTFESNGCSKHNDEKYNVS